MTHDNPLCHSHLLKITFSLQAKSPKWPFIPDIAKKSFFRPETLFLVQDRFNHTYKKNMPALFLILSLFSNRVTGPELCLIIICVLHS